MDLDAAHESGSVMPGIFCWEMAVKRYEDRVYMCILYAMIAQEISA